MTFPTLRLPAGTVGPFEARHLTERYVAWLNDPEVVRYSEQRHRRHTLASCREYFDSFAGADDLFLAIEADGVGHVGNIGVAIDAPNRTADVSIMVGDRSVWGSGIGSQAWCAVVDQLLGTGRIRKVTAGTMASNRPMLRLMERSGMAVEAVRARQMVCDGAETDLVYAAVFAPAVAKKDRI